MLIKVLIYYYMNILSYIFHHLVIESYLYSYYTKLIILYVDLWSIQYFSFAILIIIHINRIIFILLKIHCFILTYKKYLWCH